MQSGLAWCCHGGLRGPSNCRSRGFREHHSRRQVFGCYELGITSGMKTECFHSPEASWGKGRKPDSGRWHHETHLQNVTQPLGGPAG